ncbi:hypothetical protein ACHAWU_001976 [Discostella pseudostelligera]|uniref:Uncharacterized protein n=1 Tax=Discostella pseudostelligera TaxID=259834 RepID=A0ABD3MKL9_9STRA
MTRRSSRGMALSAAQLAVVALLLLAAAGCDGFITITSRFGGSISISLDGDNIILPSSSSSSIAAHRNFHSMGEEIGDNNNYSDDGIQMHQRRDALNNMFRHSIAMVTLASTISTSTTAFALDMDEFESNILSKDTTNDISPKLNDDEALCKYGAPGKAMGEACARANIQRKLPGDVDVSGKVDRGDYLKCRYEYPIIGDKYVKTRVCKPSGEWEAS